MCTVTYLPKGCDHFILTFNRDETPSRSPGQVGLTRRKSRQLAFPRDEMAGGTWLAVSSDNRLACLLNGAFDRHDRTPPYRMSRGLMVLEYFDFTDSEAFFKGFDFQGMEPFTLVTYDSGLLYELRWDGDQLYRKKLNSNRPHLWSSATLYDQEVRKKRQGWFSEWLRGRTAFTREDILDFHQHAGEGNPSNDIIMNRNGVVRTVSISSIVKTSAEIDFQYKELLKGGISTAKIEIEGKVVESH